MADPYRLFGGSTPQTQTPGFQQSRPFGYTPEDLLNPMTARSLARPVSYVQTYAPPPVGNGGQGTLPGLNSYDNIGKTQTTLVGQPPTIAQPGELTQVAQEGTNIYQPPTPVPQQGALETLLRGIVEQVGGFMPADIRAHVENGLGAVANLLDIPLEILGNLPQIPLPQLFGPLAQQGNLFPSKEQFFESLPSTPEKAKAQQLMHDDPMNGLFYLSQYLQFHEVEIAHGLGVSPLVSDYFVPVNNLGDQIMLTLGLTGLPSRLTTEAYARSAARNIDSTVLNVDPSTLNPEIQRIRSEYEAGHISRDELPTVLTKAGFGFSNSIWDNMMWEMITDPLLIASMGTGVGLKLASSSGRAAMINRAVLAARNGLDAAEVAKMDAWAVGRIVRAEADRGVAIAVDDAAKKARNTSRFEWLRDFHPEYEQQALDGMSRAGRTIVKLDPLINGAAAVSRTLNAPFDLWGQFTHRGFKNGQRLAAFSSGGSVEGMFQAYGLQRILKVQHLFEGIGVPDRLKEIFGRMAANLEVSVAGDSLSRLAQEAKHVPYDMPDEIIRAQSETYHSRQALQIEGYMRRVMTQTLPTSRFGKEATEEAMAQARQVAKLQLLDILGPAADAHAMALIEDLVKNADSEMLALIEHMRFGGPVAKNFINARSLSRSALGDAALAVKKRLATGGRGGGPIVGPKAIAKRQAELERISAREALAERYTLIGPKHLTLQAANKIIAKIKAGDVNAARQAVEQYEQLFSNFAAKGLDDETLLRDLDTFLKELKAQGGLTVEVTRAKLPRELRDWYDAERSFAKRAGIDEQYKVGLAPEADKRWREVRNKEGTMIGVNAWTDIVPDASPVRNVNSLNVVRDRLFRPIRGERHLEESRRTFRRRAVEDYGLSRSQANSLFGAIRRKAGQANTMPRGLTNSELNDLLSEMHFDDATTQRLGVRGMARLVANAFEGDTFTVGISQKITGRMKSVGTRLPGNNWLGVVSERIYPMARFSYNPIFLLQEAAEPFFWNILRGVTPGMKWTKEDLNSFEALRRAGFLGEWADQWEFSPAALMVLGAKEAHRVAGPGSKFAQATESLLGEGRKVRSLAELKRLNYLRQNSRSFGLSFKKYIEDLNPSLWDEWATMAGSTDPTRVGNWYWINKAFNQPDDPKVQTFLMDAALPQHMGESARQQPLALAKHHQFINFEALRKAVREGSYTEDQFRAKMKDISEDVYADRAWAMASHVGPQRLWQLSADAYAIARGNGLAAKTEGRNVMRAMRTTNQQFAKMLNFSEEEYTSRFLSRPMKNLNSSKDVPLGGHYQLVDEENSLKFYGKQMIAPTSDESRRISRESRALAGTPTGSRAEMQQLMEHAQGGLPSVSVDAIPVGTKRPSLPSRIGGEYPQGQLVRGKEVIAYTDKRIPDVVYHVTTDMPAVRRSGYLRVGGEGGLGGDDGDRLVSMTTNRAIAEQLSNDLQLSAQVQKLPTDMVLPFLKRQAKKEGFEQNYLPRFVPGNWSQKDFLDNYFVIRSLHTEKRNPVIFGRQGAWLDPKKVGIVEIPKEKLDNGALLTDFDIGEPGGLEEIRSYGPISLGPREGVEPTGTTTRITGAAIDGSAAGAGADLRHIAGPGLDYNSLSEMAEVMLGHDQINKVVDGTRNMAPLFHMMTQNMPDDVVWRYTRDYIANPGDIHENRLRVEALRSEKLLEIQQDLNLPPQTAAENLAYIQEHLRPGSGTDYFDMNLIDMQEFQPNVAKGPPNSGVRLSGSIPSDPGGPAHTFYGWYDEKGDLAATVDITTVKQDLGETVAMPTTPGGPIGRLNMKRMYLADVPGGPSIRIPTRKSSGDQDVMRLFTKHRIGELPRVDVPEVTAMGTKLTKAGQGYGSKLIKYIDDYGEYKYADITGRGSYEMAGSAAAEKWLQRQDPEDLAAAKEALAARMMAGYSYIAHMSDQDPHEIIRTMQAVLEAGSGKHSRAVPAQHIAIEQMLDFARVGGDEINPNWAQRAHLESMMHPNVRQVDTINPSMEGARAFGYVDEEHLAALERGYGKAEVVGSKYNILPWLSRKEYFHDVAGGRQLGFVEQADLTRAQMEGGLLGVTGIEAQGPPMLDLTTESDYLGYVEGVRQTRGDSVAVHSGEVTPAQFAHMQQQYRKWAGEANANAWAGRTDWTAADIQAVNIARYRAFTKHTGRDANAEGLMSSQFASINFELEPHPGTDFFESFPNTEWAHSLASRRPDLVSQWNDGSLKSHHDIAKWWASVLGEDTGVSVIQYSTGQGKHVVNFSKALENAPTRAWAEGQARRSVTDAQHATMVANGEWDEYVTDFLSDFSVDNTGEFSAYGPQISIVVTGSPESIEAAVAHTGATFQRREVMASYVDYAREPGKAVKSNWEQDSVTDFVIPADMPENAINHLVDQLWVNGDLARTPITLPNGDRAIRVFHEVGVVNERGLEALKPLRSGPDATIVSEIESMGVTVQRGVADMYRQAVDINLDRSGIIDFFEKEGEFTGPDGKVRIKADLDKADWDSELNWHVGKLTDPWLAHYDKLGAEHAYTALRNRRRGEALAQTNTAYWEHLGDFLEEWRARDINLPPSIRGYHYQLGPKGVRAATKVHADLNASIFLLPKVGPDSIPHELMHSMVPHFEDSMLVAIADAYASATGKRVYHKTVNAKAVLTDAQEEWLAGEFSKYSSTATVRDSKLQSAFNMMGKMTKEHSGVKKLAEAHPDAKALFDKMLGQENAHLSAVPFDPDQYRILAMARYLMAQSEDEAHTTHYFARGRNFLERSVNHPYLGYYPASYMWGKVVPELVRFLVKEPFGIKAPLAGYMMASHVAQAITLEFNTNPDTRKWVEDHPQLIRFVQMMLPGTPWDIPVNMPAWMRHTAREEARNAIREQGGQPSKHADILAELANSANYAFGIGRSFQTAAQIGAEFNPPAPKPVQTSGLNEAQQYLQAYGIGQPPTNPDLAAATETLSPLLDQ